MKKQKSAFYVILAGILWGVISLFVNPMSDRGFSSQEIGFSRFLFCALILFVFLIFYDKKLLKIKLKDIWIFLGTGVVSLALFSYFYLTTIIKSETSIAVALLYTSPVFIMIFSAILFKEKITFNKIIAIILTILGCVLISGILTNDYSISLSVFIYGLLSGLFYASYSIFGRFATNRNYDTLTINFYTFLFASIGFLVFVNPVKTAQHFANDYKAILISFFSAIVCGILPYLFYTKGLKGLDTSIAGVLVAVEPLVGSLIGIFIFKDSTNIVKILGIILILASIVIASLNKESKQQ